MTVIGWAKQSGKLVEVHDPKGNGLWYCPGRGLGYTSHTVTIDTGATTKVFAPRGNVIRYWQSDNWPEEDERKNQEEKGSRRSKNSESFSSSSGSSPDLATFIGVILGGLLCFLFSMCTKN